MNRTLPARGALTLLTCGLLLLLPGATWAGTYVLIVGVNTRPQGARGRDTFAEEARLIRSAFFRRSPRGRPGLPPGVKMNTLLGSQATRHSVLAGLDWLGRMTARDTAFVYLGAHGGGHRFGISVWAGTGPRRRPGSVSGAEIQARLRRLRGPCVLFLDTCHAARVFRQARGWGKCTVVAACRSGQKARVGRMSPALVRGVRGQADLNGNGAVAIDELRHYVVRYMARHQNRRKPEHPVVRRTPASARARLVRAQVRR